MATETVGVREPIKFGEGYELDFRPRRLHHGSHVLKLERIPLEILVLLLEHNNEIVTREQIVSRIWGPDVFLDTDNSIRGAIRKLRRVLEDDAETPRFILTVTGQGYRFIAPVMASGETTLANPPEQNPSSLFEQDKERVEKTPRAGTALEATKRSTRTRLLAVAVASLVVACFAILFAVSARRRTSSLPGTTPRKIVLAVLPFENLSRDPDQEFFSDGLTEEMIAQIGKLNRRQLAVIARSSVAKYAGSTLTAREIGRELNADYLLEGSVRRSAEHARITVQLIQAQNQTALWTESYDRELKDVLAVQDSVVRSIADQIHLSLTEEQKARLANSRRARPEAYVAYLKGRYYWNKRTGDNMRKAEAYFQQAIDSDPTYAAAYSGLADCNSGLAWHGYKSPAEALSKANAAARKAIELDPQSGEAHASLGLMLSHHWEWAEAEAEFGRALELDPQYANAHHWYGDYLSIHSRHEEAVSEARRALELDPLNLMISTWAGLRYYLARNYSAAIEQNRDSVELDPNFAAAHLLLGEDYVQAGTHSEAIDELKRAAALSGNSPIYASQVGVALAAAGRMREALQVARELQASSTKTYVSPYGLAQIYATLHMEDETFQWLQSAYDDHAVWMGYLAVDPVFDRYRSDRRFQDLLARIGLP
ncbi:MAG TPA: winged helix-turn-helix domain-containing protein [Terriglobales bacterium]|nr:winged helix-turn-helix domain-containing protein [Terriglobales bacterium]